MQKHKPLIIPPDHPAFAGHFPGMPIVPGVLLLDEVLHALATETGLAVTDWQISAVKFLSPLTPGESAVIQYEQLSQEAIKFAVLTAGTQDHRQIVSGTLAPGNGGPR